MVFSSLLFLFRFFPVVLILYYAAPRKIRNIILFIFSLFFYAWGEPKYVFLMLFAITMDYTVGMLIDKYKQRGEQGKARMCLVVSIVTNLSILGFFKYADFIIGSINGVTGLGIPLLEIPLPIGISFFTFQTMSYTIDVYWGKTKVQKNWLNYGTYVSMFPQLIAGPIVQYKTIANQINKRDRESFSDFSAGIHRFMIGLGKKVLLANNIGSLWDTIAALPMNEISAATAWLGAIAFTFQIYFDFSAYSDMAIGLGKMFGFHYLENFNYPYMSKSITDFWRRWHISLSSWFKEYVYIPLGGNRKGMAKQIRNIVIVWLLTGIWHGAHWNYVLWGVYYGILLIIEKMFLGKYIQKLPGWIQNFYTMFLVIISWVLFKCEDLSLCGEFLKAMFGGFGTGFINSDTLYYIYNNGVLLVLLILGCTTLPKKLAQRCTAGMKQDSWVLVVLKCLFYGAIFVLSTAYLVDATYNPFLYFRF